MKLLKTAAVLVALAGCVALAPQAYGQSRGRELTILGGRGGELGVRVSDADSGGVEITDVERDSAADKAGLKRGDIIVEFDGEHVRSGRQFARLVRETASGRSVKTTIVREGKRQDVTVTPSAGTGFEQFGDRLIPFDRFEFRELDRLRDLPFDFRFDFPRPGSSRLGVEVDELSDQLAGYFGARGGVLVTSVVDGSAASRAGLKAGDVITSVNGASVASRSDLIRALRDVDGGAETTIGIVRDRKEMTVTAKVEAPRRTLRGRPA